MTKAELISRTVDAMVDPWTDNPEDYLDATPIYDLEQAKDMLSDLHAYDIDLEPDEILPDEVTPAIVMEAYNCLIRAKKFEARTERLADWIRENDPVCEYCNYYLPAHEDAIDLCPVDFLCDTDGFPFLKDDPSPLDLLCIGMNSRKTFDPQDEYCWFDAELSTLHSTNAPFTDGTLDAEAFARFILLDEETLEYMLDGIIDGKDAEYILGCTKEEYAHE